MHVSTDILIQIESSQERTPEKAVYVAPQLTLLTTEQVEGGVIALPEGNGGIIS